MRVNSGTNRTVAMRFTRFAYSSFVTEERVEGSVLLDFFVTFLIKQESLNFHRNVLSYGGGPLSKSGDLQLTD
jgi:hypothetical protein